MSNHKNFAAQVQAAVATREAHDERPVLIMAQDEGRFGRLSRPKRCWAIQQTIAITLRGYGNLGATSTEFGEPWKKSAPIIGIDRSLSGKTALHLVSFTEIL